MNIKNEKRKIKEIEGKEFIFDYIRKKYILLTPEEIVRQNFLDYLIEEKKYSKNLIKLESGIVYNSLNKRSDIIVYDNKGAALMLVECKSNAVAISQKTVEQASRYNLMIKAPYLCVTNGEKTFCFNINFENNKIIQIKEIPNLI
jgi:hypothetical protein